MSDFKAKKKKAMELFALRLKPQTVRRLRTLARKQDVKTTELARQMIEHYIEGES